MARKRTRKTGAATSPEPSPLKRARGQESSALSDTVSALITGNPSVPSKLAIPQMLDETNGSGMEMALPNAESGIEVASERKPVSFLDLSRELRDPIYHYAISNARTEFLCRWRRMIFSVRSTLDEVDDDKGEEDTDAADTDEDDIDEDATDEDDTDEDDTDEDDKPKDDAADNGAGDRETEPQYGLPVFMLANKQIFQEGLEEIYHQCQLNMRSLSRHMIHPSRRICRSIQPGNFRRIKFHVIFPLIRAGEGQLSPWVYSYLEECNNALTEIVERRPYPTVEKWEQIEVEVGWIPAPSYTNLRIPLEVKESFMIQPQDLPQFLDYPTRRLNINEVRFKICEQILMQFRTVDHYKWASLLGSTGKRIIQQRRSAIRTKLHSAPGLVEVSRVKTFIYE